MGKFSFVCALVALPLLGHSQNLVPNPSFECGVDIFCGPYQLLEIQEFSKHACGWTVRGTGTSDIFYLTPTPIPGCFLGMPSSGIGNYIGSQLPRTGKRFAGIHTYSFIPPSSPDTIGYREYLQVKLDRALKPGEKYCAEMYVSAAERASYFSNNLGMRFNVNEVFVNNYRYLGFKPQIIEPKVIKETNGWVRIGGTFEATEPANYLIIGNMYGDRSTQTAVAYSSSTTYMAYYFIDDVSVEKMPYDHFTVSGPTALCEGATIQLSASAGVDNVTWTTLQDTLTVINLGEKFSVSPKQTSAYRVKSVGCRKTVIDTLQVKVNLLPKVYLGRDTVLCNGQSIRLDAGSGFSVYRWQDQSARQTFEVRSAGTFKVEVTSAASCKASDQIEVKFIDVPKVDLGHDTLVCKGFFPLAAGGKEYEYEWADGSREPSFTPANAGKFWVRAKNRCGTVADTIRIYSPTDLFIPNIVTANNDGANDRFVLGLNPQEDEVVTNAIFPAKLSIFNRWGEAIYTSEMYTNNWPVPSSSVESGVYFYRVELPSCRDFKGWLQLIR